MKSESSKKTESRARMIASAGQAFRRNGFGGIGVDELAKSAELTSGAFYFHFRSKLGLFVESIRAGMEDLRSGVETFQTEHGRGWLKEFVAFYLGYKRTCEMGEGCTIPALSSEVARAGPEAQAVYEEALRKTADLARHGLKNGKHLTKQETAWALLALLSGGVNMARAVQDPKLSEEIAAAVSKAALALAKT